MSRISSFQIAIALMLMLQIALATAEGTNAPTDAPVTSVPTLSPSFSPTLKPSEAPTLRPTESPTLKPTAAPTNAPTAAPTNAPTSSPTSRPTSVPTLKPTASPTNAPTSSPTSSPSTSPTSSPTSEPTTSAPTTQTPTGSPTSSPTIKLPPVPLKPDCLDYPTSAECGVIKDSMCGACTWYSETVKYVMRMTIDFVLDGNRRFVEFEDSTQPPKTTFKTALKNLLLAHTNGLVNIGIVKIGQIRQELGKNYGSVVYEINFNDNVSSKELTKKYINSNPDFYDYVPELNAQLNKLLRTKGITYITGKAFIDRLNFADLAPGKGACGCASDVLSASTHTAAYSTPITVGITMFSVISSIIFFLI